MYTQSNILHKWFPVFLLTGVFINATGIFSFIIEPDGMLYASIAKHIAVTNDWVNLFGNGSDWLDKPHFPFWVAALSFKLFGISSFTYKLPAFIFWLAGIYILYIFVKKVYNRTVAELAVIIYVVAAHSVISNFDVRAEPYLTTVMLGALYFLYQYQTTRKFSNIIWAALFTAASIMTKGIFILIPVAGSLVFYWIRTKQWKEFANIAWYIYGLLVAIFILPELYCLYVQFDLHPEKVVYGKTNVSGLRFFFWDSQFGRFFNTGPIKGKGNLFFFFHTTLWAFLPWTIVLCLSVFNSFKRTVSRGSKEYLLLVYSALITFILFSVSSFQLPHYIIIIFPQLAAISAAYLIDAASKLRLMKTLTIIQSVIFYLVAAIIITVDFVFNMHGKWPIAFFVVAIIILATIPFQTTALINFLRKSFCISLTVHLFFNLFFYPQLEPYQGGTQAAKWLNKQNKKYPVVVYSDNSHSPEFYTNNHIKRIYEADSLKHFISDSSQYIIYVSDAHLKEVQQQGLQTNIIQSFDNYPISQLSLKFINYKTRSSTLNKVYLCSVVPSTDSVNKK